jgi:diacylglycerol kinase family enzyme
LTARYVPCVGSVAAAAGGVTHALMTHVVVQNGRLDVVRLAMAMKSGKYLGEQKGVVSYLVKEFKLTPTECKSPFLIDGDPHEHGPVHVKVLHKALSVQHPPFFPHSFKRLLNKNCALLEGVCAA